MQAEAYAPSLSVGLTISTNAPLDLTAPVKPELDISASAMTTVKKTQEPVAKDGASAGSSTTTTPTTTSTSTSNASGTTSSTRPDHLKPRLCTVPGCKKRVRSKGLCKAHGGGRRCMYEGCERSSQGQGLCIRHGGGKRCTQPGCTKASQSNGLCKAHGGGLRCQAPGCTKSSQGGGFCRAHGGGQRCEKEGCNKGAQRGGFCAGHGGSRFCQHPECTKNDRGGGFCAEHGGGKRCDEPDCNKPARKKGKCSYHANAHKQKQPKEAIPSTAPGGPMMDMRQITAQAYTMNGMPAMPKDPAAAQREYAQMASYPRVDMDQRYGRAYDQPLPLPANHASAQYMQMPPDQRAYDLNASRHYIGSLDQASLPSVTSNYMKPQMPMDDRQANAYNAQRHAYQQHWVKEGGAPGAMPERPGMEYIDHAAQHPQQPPPQYANPSAQQYQQQQQQHMTQAESAAAAYSAQRENYYRQQQAGPHDTASNEQGMMYYSTGGYAPQQMHNMGLL